MTEKELNAIKERLAKATKGKWEYEKDTHSIYTDKGQDIVCEFSFYDVEDATFITHSKQDISALIASVEKLSKAIERFCNDANFVPPWESAGAKWWQMLKRLHDEWLDAVGEKEQQCQPKK